MSSGRDHGLDPSIAEKQLFHLPFLFLVLPLGDMFLLAKAL